MQKYEEDPVFSVYHQHQEKIEKWTKGRLLKNGIYDEDTMQDARLYICESIIKFWPNATNNFDIFLMSALKWFVMQTKAKFFKGENKFDFISLDYEVEGRNIYDDFVDYRQLNDENNILNKIEINRWTDMMKEELGEEYVKTFLLRSEGYTLEEVGDIISVTGVTISKWENEIKDWIEIKRGIKEEVKKICKYCGTTEDMQTRKMRNPRTNKWYDAVHNTCNTCADERRSTKVERNKAQRLNLKKKLKYKNFMSRFTPDYRISIVETS